MAYTPYPGPQGGIRVGGTAVAGINKWSFDKVVQLTQSTNFETTADSNGVVWETQLLGLGSSTGSCEGLFDGDTTNSEERFPIGTQIVLDLYYKKSATAVGATSVPAVVTGLSFGQDLRGNGTFRMQFTTSGTPPVMA